MFPHFIALPLPTDLRKRLASFCYGIPQVKWLEEENFNLVIRYFGPINEIAILDIRENLKNLFFHPLTITLQGITHNYSKKSGGIISIGIVPNPQILLLRKEI